VDAFAVWSVIEKSMRIDPVPQPPFAASQEMIASELVLLGWVSTGVFQGFCAVKMPPPAPPPPDEPLLDDAAALPVVPLLDEDAATLPLEPLLDEDAATLPVVPLLDEEVTPLEPWPEELLDEELVEAALLDAALPCPPRPPCPPHPPCPPCPPGPPRPPCPCHREEASARVSSGASSEQAESTSTKTTDSPAKRVNRCMVLAP
jgi:hypothetical protein